MHNNGAERRERATVVMPVPDNDIIAGLCRATKPEVIRTVYRVVAHAHGGTDVNFARRQRAIIGLGRHELTKQRVRVCVCVDCVRCLLTRRRACQDHP